tara:strand:- start:127663 stop:128595 length:933 start_codon:yes stop_codon:yes gene_type:complete
MSQSVPKKIRVLMIEDDDVDAAFINRLLTSCPDQTFSVDHVKSLSAAIETLSKNDYEAALLDLSLPDAVGLESFEKIRALDARLPVVMLTGMNDEDVGLQAIESGAQDFVAKEHVSGQMLFRVLRFAIARQLKVMGFQAAADTDPLTSLPNRRYLQSHFDEFIKSAEIKNTPASLAILDVDHFKSINDQYGHFVGDAVLKKIAEIMTQTLGENACAMRIGGEEFAVLMLDDDIDQACQRIDQLLKTLASTTMSFDELSIVVTASAGVIELKYSDIWDKAFVAADSALYEAKSSGRNCYQRRDRIESSTAV